MDIDARMLRDLSAIGFTILFLLFSWFAPIEMWIKVKNK